MKIKELIKTIDDFAPFTLQEDYDNSGIQLGNPEKEISRGLICFDVTEDIVEEAVSKSCDLIISHHPVIFNGIKSLTGKSYVERIIIKAVKNDISIVSVHTNLDVVRQGVNQRFAEKLGLKKTKILQPQKGLLKKLVTFCPKAEAARVREAIFKAGAGQIGEYDCCSFNLEGEGTFRGGENTNPFVGEKGNLHFEPEIRIETILPSFLVSFVVNAMIEAHPYEEVAWDIYPLENKFDKVGMGMIGYLEKEISEIELLQQVKELLNVPFIRHSPITGKNIKKVAVCGGSGSFLRSRAISVGADVFITADLKYHDFFEAHPSILLIDAGHYETEQFTKEILYEILTKKNTNFALLISELNTNPVRYL